MNIMSIVFNFMVYFFALLSVLPSFDYWEIKKGENIFFLIFFFFYDFTFNEWLEFCSLGFLTFDVYSMLV